MCAVHVDLPDMGSLAEMAESRPTGAHLAALAGEIQPQFIDKITGIGPKSLDSSEQKENKAITVGNHRGNSVFSPRFPQPVNRAVPQDGTMTMLLTLTLIALLAVTLVATFGVLADSAVRGWNAYGDLRRTARATHTLMPAARYKEEIALARLPEMRTFAVTRHGGAFNTPRSTRRRLPAAA